MFAIVEQDMYPCAVDAPLPIAQRTRKLSRVLRRSVRSLQLRIEELEKPCLIYVLPSSVSASWAPTTSPASTARIAGARVTVVNDYLTEKAEELAATIPGCRAIADPLDAIADPDVDAVVLATPGPTHEKQLLACLEHGKPVMCEKPLTTDVDNVARGGQA